MDIVVMTKTDVLKVH